MPPRQLTDGEKEILQELDEDAYPAEEEMRAWEQDMEDRIAPPELDYAFFRVADWEEDCIDMRDQAVRMATY